MTPIQHLERLLNSVRQMRAPAQFHDAMRASAEAIAQALVPLPKPEPEKGAPDAGNLP